jgi:hypothetical protein
MLDEQQTPADTTDTDAIPETLTFRVEQPKRLLQAAKAMVVLEGDLRTLMGRTDRDLDPNAVTWAATTYTGLRGEVIALLDPEGVADAEDPIIGLPELADGPSSDELLLKLSQATRFLSVEEAWPGAYVGAKAARDQFVRHANGSSGPGLSLPTQLGADQGPGYI